MEILSISVIISVISLFLWASICFDRRRIRVNAENLGYKDIKITWVLLTSRSIFSLLFGKDKVRYYRVTHVGRDGDVLTRQCKSSFVTGVFWLDEWDVYSSNSCLVAIAFYLLLFFGLYQGIVVAIHWVR